MGEIAEMMLDGTMCQYCGEFLDSDNGFPTACAGCGDDDDVVVEFANHQPRHKKKKHQAQIDRWFFYNNAPKGNGPALDVFLDETEFDGFKKGKRDRTGKLLIFLTLGGVSVAAVRCEEQYYPSALAKVRGEDSGLDVAF